MINPTLSPEKNPLTHSGYVAIIGFPNVGKSTLINTIIGEKLAITTYKPQTTQSKIIGIHTHKHAQFVFIDSPGLASNRHQSLQVNSLLIKQSMSALHQADIVILLFDATKSNADAIKRIKTLTCDLQVPKVLVLNKTDLIKNKKRLLPMMLELHNHFPNTVTIPISAKKSDQISVLLDHLLIDLPEQGALFPTENYTIHSTRFLSSELIRERIMIYLRSEVPYQTAVKIEEWRETDARVEIDARIIVDKTSQKGILLGNRGSMIKKIGQNAREEIEQLTGKKVRLDLFVAVDKKWTTNSYKINDYQQLDIL